MNTVVETISTIVDSQRQQFNSVVAVKSINFDREAQFAKQILGDPNSYLHKTAMANKASLIFAINNVAAIGISLNPASRLAYLVPRKGSICLDISYMGVMHVAQVCGAIKWGQARIVREGEEFRLNGVDCPPTHNFNPFEPEQGDIIGCYIVVKTDEGDYLTHTMPIDAIEAIRDRSESWKSREKKIHDPKYNGPIPNSPWESDFEEMAKKTVVKQASKYWPRREHLDGVIHYLNDPETEGIDFKEVKEATEPIPGTSGVSPAQEALTDQTVAGQTTAGEIAVKVKELLDEGYEWEAHDKVYNDHVDGDLRLAVWAVLKNDKMLVDGKPILYRSLITKCHDADEAGQRPEATPPEL